MGFESMNCLAFMTTVPTLFFLFFFSTLHPNWNRSCCTAKCNYEHFHTYRLRAFFVDGLFLQLYIVWHVLRNSVPWEVEKIYNLKGSTDGILTHNPQLGPAGLQCDYRYGYLVPILYEAN